MRPLATTASPSIATPDTDAVLVAHARLGDGDAFGALVRRHQRAVHALAYSLVSDASEAEDLTQEAFLRAFRNFDMLADPDRFAAWLHRVTFGTCIDWLRAFRPALFQSSYATDEDLLNTSSPEPPASQVVERAELTARVLRALDALPPRYRVPLSMYHLDGLSHERVAAALDVPTATVRSLVHRARAKLATLLADLHDDVAPGEIGVFDKSDAPRSMLHVLNGDSTRMSLEESNVPGRFTVWADVLYEGPVPRDVDDATFAEARARFHTGERVSYDDALAMHRRWDAGMASAADVDEVVLWFEHDLFDQVLLVHHMDWFARQTARPYILSLICIGEFPTVEPFHGLGQLTPDQLASLLDTRQRVTERQLALGQSMWRAFTGDDPTAIERVLSRDTSALPFLDGAMHRLLEEFPDSNTGLPRTERTILEILAARGPMRFADLFPAQQKTEERVFMGDTTIWDRLHDLARGSHPLVRIDAATADRATLDSTFTITGDGRRVLTGELDWMAIAPFDRWIGGSHLVAPAVGWRWDSASRRLAGE